MDPTDTSSNEPNGDSRRTANGTRKFLQGVAATIATLTSFLALYQWLEPKWRTRDEATVWISNGDEIRFDSAKPIRGHTVARRIVIPNGVALAESGAILVTDELEIGESAALRGHDAVVVARRIIGGTLDFSGAEGNEQKRDGEDGGKLVVVTAEIRSSQIDVSGGGGAKGMNGVRGSDGRNGRCGPGVFGEFRGSQDGGPGGNGGPGGIGGDAGSLVIFAAKNDPVRATASGGRGGAGGNRGDGGAGGAGCMGIGGSQPTRANGPNGESGTNGADGRGSVPRCSTLPVSTLRKFAREVSTTHIDLEARLTALASAAIGRC